jgi:hypothetical protein
MTNAFMDKYARRLLAVSEEAWAEVVNLPMAQLKSLKDAAEDHRLQAPSPHARMAGHLVEAVCEAELAARGVKI